MFFFSPSSSSSSAVNSRNFLQNVLRSVKNLVVAFDEKGYVTTFNHS
eukprot:COSAG06_NODE_25481_length_635_cov_2.628731_2_plen_46_part_01